jgi:RNA recognition motif-containing protein
MNTKDRARRSVIFVGDIEDTLDDTGLAALCAPYGTVTSARIQRSRVSHKSLGYGFVTMATHQEGELCIAKLDGVVVGKRPIRVDWAERNRTLLVFNMSPSTIPESLFAIFGNFGGIEERSIVEATHGMYVCMNE